MAKILISSLGTGYKRDGGYRKATYEYLEQKHETTFISKSLTKFLDIDKVFLVGTSGSIWDSCYHEFGGLDDDVELSLYEKVQEKTLDRSDLSIVENTINKYNNNHGSQCFLIDYGINEIELWENFDKYLQILDYIDDGDVLYLDISHAFRSLALMSFLMVQFGHIIKEKKFKIGGIFYGMLEYAPENNNITPIVDLKIFYDLMEWIKAIDNFKNYANGDKIALLLKKNEELKKEYNIFNNFTNAMRIANMTDIKNNINSISQKLVILKDSRNPIISLMTKEMEDFVNRLDKKKISEFQLALADWYFEHKHYALAYMALIESIVSKVCEVKEYNVQSESRRKNAKFEISGVSSELYYDVYRGANEIRNNIAHQLQNNRQSQQDIRNLETYIKKTTRIFQTL